MDKASLLPVVVMLVSSLLFLLYNTIIMWRIFTKAGISGFWCIVPIASMWKYFRVGKLPGWLSLIPIVNLVLMLVATWRMCTAFHLGIFLHVMGIFLPVIPLSCIAFNNLLEYEF